MTTRPLFALCMALFAAASFLSLRAEDKPKEHKFEKDILAFEALDKKNPPPEGAIVLAGASMFTRWKSVAQDLPGYTIVNRGFGGSQMSDLLYYADRIVIPYKPKMVVTLEGGNDLHAGKTPEQILADYKAFVAKVRAKLPNVRIVISSLAPCSNRWADADKQRQTNVLLKQLVASETNLDYIDLFDAYLGTDGKPRDELFGPDKQHNNAEGYKVRAELMKPHLDWVKKN